MIRVKVCGLSDPLNVKAISETGIDYAGFIFYPGSKRYVGPTPDKSLFSGVPERIKKAGVFVNEEPEKLLHQAEYATLDIIQLHGSESVTYCKLLKGKGFEVIKVFGVGPDFDPRKTDAYSEVCDYFLFDTSHMQLGGTGIKFEWELLIDHSFAKPFFLSGGIGPDDHEKAAAILNNKFYAVDINSRFEMSTGIKDAAMVKKFISKIKNIQR